MRISLEWVLEFAAAAVLFGMIMVGVRAGAVPAETSVPEIYEDVSEQENTNEDEKAENEKAKEEKKTPEKYRIKNFRIILQNPELPTGCEITAMTMVLNYYGFSADKVDMAVQYLPTAPAEFYYDEDGLLYGTDLTRCFVGEPMDSDGYICGTKAICTAANKYLHKMGSTFRAADKTGASVKELYRWVSEDIPVVVWVTINMEERQVVEGWHTEDSGYVDWATNDHGAVLIGYTKDTVTIADPIAGRVEYERETFEEIFESRENQCVILRE